ncbi:MAG: L-glutamate gamma-semialdehyde dehydrogenase [Polyangiales bacterium]
MLTARLQTPPALNEPVLSYAPGTSERASLERTLADFASKRVDIPMFIGGEEVRTGTTTTVHAPHRHELVLGEWHRGNASHVTRAIDAALAARASWSAMPWNARAAVFLKAAELLATKHRQRLNAATMLCQSKTAHQAEIDAACELIDFWRFNVAFAERLYSDQPLSPPGVWNQLELRPLEGFVLAVTPFNFTSIAGNLPTAPALMGNTVVWKPSATAVYSAWFLLEILREAGLPDGVINLVLGPPGEVVDTAISHPAFAGLHFTGSTDVFQGLWAKVGANVAANRYRTYPRLVGETGGKDFIFAHPSADLDALAVAVLRGGYEYQGQKCSAASRIYVPRSLWKGLSDRVTAMIDEVRVGDITDFKNFMGAVIDRRAYDRLSGRLAAARADAHCEVLRGGADDRVGYFIQPTLVRTDDPHHALMRDELFGPLVTAFVYDDDRYDEALTLCDEGSPYALTGAFFARDRGAIEGALARLRETAGNFYINDKPTGAVVAQQPFGGARASGTNDKAGSAMNLLRWSSARAIKETFVPPTTWRYPFMG